MPKEVQITPEVRDVLERSTIAGPEARPVLMLPSGQMARPLYVAVDKVLKALGGKWNRGAGGHVFDKPLDGPLAEALRAGAAVDLKRTFEQFYTPHEVVLQLCDLAGDIEGTDVLEPSAGRGGILFELIGRGAFPTAVEISAELALQLESETEGRVPIYCADFLKWVPRSPECPRDFDRVIMNPPFGRGQDMAHVRRAYDLLRPGGLVVSVMSPHWTFAGERAAVNFRNFVHSHDYAWRQLPEGTFKASGTGVATGILTIWKGTD